MKMSIMQVDYQRCYYIAFDNMHNAIMLAAEV